MLKIFQCGGGMGYSDLRGVEDLVDEKENVSMVFGNTDLGDSRY